MDLLERVARVEWVDRLLVMLAEKSNELLRKFEAMGVNISEDQDLRTLKAYVDDFLVSRTSWKNQLIAEADASGGEDVTYRLGFGVFNVLSQYSWRDIPNLNTVKDSLKHNFSVNWIDFIKDKFNDLETVEGNYLEVKSEGLSLWHFWNNKNLELGITYESFRNLNSTLQDKVTSSDKLPNKWYLPKDFDWENYDVEVLNGKIDSTVLTTIREYLNRVEIPDWFLDYTRKIPERVNGIVSNISFPVLRDDNILPGLTLSETRKFKRYLLRIDASDVPDRKDIPAQQLDCADAALWIYMQCLYKATGQNIDDTLGNLGAADESSFCASMYSEPGQSLTTMVWTPADGSFWDSKVIQPGMQIYYSNPTGSSDYTGHVETITRVRYNSDGTVKNFDIIQGHGDPTINGGRVNTPDYISRSSRHAENLNKNPQVLKLEGVGFVTP
jgi:hypothetical protein